MLPASKAKFLRDAQSCWSADIRSAVREHPARISAISRTARLIMIEASLPRKWIVSAEAPAALYSARRAKVMKREKISELTTNRLSVYLRCLNELAAAGIKTVSSQELAEQFNLNSAQIRKDLGYFGEFGVRGVGYYVGDLREHITEILGLDRPHRVGIIGAGRLGTALANYQGFGKSNFTVVALFDNDQAKVGERMGEGESV